MRACFVLLIVSFGFAAMPANAQKANMGASLAQLQGMASRFAPTPLRVDTARRW